MASVQSLPPAATDTPVTSTGSAGLTGPEVVKRLEERLAQEERTRERLEQRLHEMEGVLQTERQEKLLVVEELREIQDRLANEEAPQ